MKPYSYPILKFLTISALLALGSNFSVQYILGELGKDNYVILGTTSSIVAAFWFAYDRFMWRWKLGPWVRFSNLPDLNGEWFGDVNRLGEQAPHSFKMVITQTYSHISIETSTDKSKSVSISANFMVDETGKVFDLQNYWTCTTEKRDDPSGSMEDFKGFSYISIRQDIEVIVLKDYYFTDRNPPTQGRLTLRQDN